MANVQPRREGAPPVCGVCRLHGDPDARERWEIGREELWLLRHHPDPAPLAGWMLLDAVRHLGGPVDFTPSEAAAWGRAIQAASRLVRELTGCERVYAIAFGEGARHLHLHLIPRHAGEETSEAWAVADLYRAVAAGRPPAADHAAREALVQRARTLWKDERLGFSLKP